MAAKPPTDTLEVVLEKNAKLLGVLDEKHAQIAELQQKAAEASGLKSQYVDALGASTRCWSQLQLQLELSLTRLGETAAINSSAAPGAEDTFLSSVKKSWENSQDANVGANIENELARSCQRIGQLALDLAQTAERCKGSTPDSSAAHDMIQAKLVASDMERSILKERVEVAEAKWSESEKQYEDTAAQLLVAKRSQHMLRQEIAQLKEAGPAVTKEEAKPDTNSKPATKDEVAPEVTQITADLVEMRAESEKKGETIAELNLQLSRSQSQLAQHKMSEQDVSEDAVQSSIHFINLNMMLQKTQQELKVARQEVERLKFDKETTEATHMLEVEQSKAHVMEQQQKSEAEFEKLRQDNSRLISEVEALKSTLGSREVTADLAPQIQEQQSLIQTLKNQLDRANKAKTHQQELLQVAEKQAKAATENNKDELVAQLNAKLEMKETEIEDYLEEINEVAKAYEDLQSQNIRLLEQLKLKEDAKNNLIEERIKTKHIESMLRAQKEELQRKATLIQEEKDAATMVQAKLEEQLAKAELKASNLQQAEMLQTKLVESHKTFTNDAMVLYNGTKAKLDAKEKAFNTLKDDFKNVSDQFNTEQRERQKLSEKVHSLNKKLSYYNSFGGGKKSGSEQELEDMKQLYTCKIDSTKMLGLDKFCVITKCYHIFSDSGLQHNLANRNRKCPACQTAFDRADVKPIFIDF